MKKTIEIPEGYEARIESNKVILEPKESEDERIRKALINKIRRMDNEEDFYADDYDADQLCTWLEKRGKQKNIQTVNDIWKDMRLEAGAQASGNRHEPLYSDNSTKLFSLNDIDEIIEKISEKQGSQNLANSVKTCKVEPTRFRVGDTIRLKGSTAEYAIKSIDEEYYHGKGWLLSISAEDNYELVEQRPEPFKAEHGKYYYCIKDYFSGGKKQASKGDVIQALRGLPIMGLDDASEFFLPVNDMQLNNGINHNNCPKFKVGDWIISDTANKDYHICKITGIKDGNYTIESTCGYKGYNQFDMFDTIYRLWTIQDAKDGDILAEHETIVLFKQIEGLNIKCYCTYHYLGFNPTFRVDTLQNKIPYRPATKEYCDKLEKAITKAGYKWDAEKKELVKDTSRLA